MKRKECLDIVQKMIADGVVTQDDAARYFPELKKSEDEKIVKELKAFIRSRGSHITQSQTDAWIAYLEKQGEKASDKIVEKAKTEKQRVLLTETNGVANIDWDTRSLQDVKLLLEYGLDYINHLEKQGEQKRIIADRELTDFEIEVHEIITQARSDKRLTDKEALKQFEQEAALALMMKAEKEQEQKPTTELGDEDNSILDALIRRLEGEDIHISPHLAVKALKLLKDKVQSQKRWKPTEEQMMALLDSFQVGIGRTKQDMLLESLYEQLKIL